MRFCLTILVSACIAFSFASTSDAASVAKPPKPDFSSMRFQLGTWSCTVNVPHRGSTTYTAVYSIDPSGYYLVRRTTDHGAPWFPYPTTRVVMITYDRDIKQWARVATSSFGDYELGMSAGWSDGKMVWHDLIPPQADTYQSDLTITKVSDTHVTDERTVTEKAVKTVVSRGSCNKSS